MTTKTCKYCDTEITEPRVRICASCKSSRRKEYTAKYREKNRQKIRDYAREQYHLNADDPDFRRKRRESQVNCINRSEERKQYLKEYHKQYAKKNREKINAYQRDYHQRHSDDQEYRENRKKSQEKYMTKRENKDKINERTNSRYANDAEFKERKLLAGKKYREKNKDTEEYKAMRREQAKRRREKVKSDPVLLEKDRAYRREYYLKTKFRKLSDKLI
ncbi:phage tail tape measure protein [Flammeovirga agarivorans]|uniref:Phage tail tape measure protein n=1 Tax=Flammeovirga agarivorans TaxID=2726742 RepID=A0A7X8XZ98_9BACT|nr:phage tail tape measure protein [Flammeovirga agarivorans]NLR94966.1 phage tail tape measure protein [Flammeovirga agarivorans]